MHLKDGVFLPSNPFLHMTELCATLELEKASPPVIFLYVDGGTDHRVTLKSLQLSLIALWNVFNIDMPVAGHTCPGHSYCNPVEQVMSTLNVGLWNAAFVRKPCLMLVKLH